MNYGIFKNYRFHFAYNDEFSCIKSHAAGVINPVPKVYTLQYYLSIPQYTGSRENRFHETYGILPSLIKFNYSV